MLHASDKAETLYLTAEVQMMDMEVLPEQAPNESTSRTGACPPGWCPCFAAWQPPAAAAAEPAAAAGWRLPCSAAAATDQSQLWPSWRLESPDHQAGRAPVSWQVSCSMLCHLS